MSTRYTGHSIESAYAQVRENVLSQEVDGETVILDLVSGQYFGLNELGSRIWDLLLEGNSVGQVIDLLLGEYDVSEDRLRADVQQLLERLASKGLLELRNAGSD